MGVNSVAIVVTSVGTVWFLVQAVRCVKAGRRFE
jgi:hypothetical protein